MTDQSTLVCSNLNPSMLESHLVLSTLDPQPSTLNPSVLESHLVLSTLNPQPSTLNPSVLESHLVTCVLQNLLDCKIEDALERPPHRAHSPEKEEIKYVSGQSGVGGDLISFSLVGQFNICGQSRPTWGQ